MDYIYSRVSTHDQSVAAQNLQIQAKYPHAVMVSETASGGKARPILKTLLKELQKGDCLIVAALDRIARNAWELLGIARDLESRGVLLISIRENIEFSTMTGKLVLGVLASVAELELNLIRERTKHGLAAARAKGRVGGRPKTKDQAVLDEAVQAVRGGLSYREAEKKFGVSRSYLNQLAVKSRVRK